MLIGYMRVSKADGSQSTDLQRDALISAGVSPVHLYEDQASGRRDERPGLTACLKALRDGDTLLVWKLDRLGRNLRHLVNWTSSDSVNIFELRATGAASRNFVCRRESENKSAKNWAKLGLLCITPFPAFPNQLNQQVTSANLSEIGVMQRFLREAENAHMKS